MNRVNSVEAPEYGAQCSKEEGIIAQALAILHGRMVARPVMSDPSSVRSYLVLRAGAERDQNVERFGVMFLDNQNCIIECETLFTGTLNQTSVYPREVVRAALRHNAAAVILTHNHPSGSVQPSRADEALTSVLKNALSLVDVRVLDHIITGGGNSLSMAEKGLI